MKPKAQQIAIAEARGWTYVRSVADRNPDNDRMSYLAGSLRSNKWDEWEVPDYPNDLNAMHDAEKMLTDDQLIDYAEWLGVCFDENPSKACVVLLRANATQRAEAFLRTIGKWEE